MHLIDALIVLAFVAQAVWAGLRYRKVASQSLEEYFLAGRTLKGWQAGFSMAATQFAADTPLLVTGLIAMSGVFALWRLWVFALAFLLLGFLLSSSWRRANVLTDAELTEIRYGAKPAAALRGIKAVYFGTVINCMILAMVLLAATRVAEPFLLWDQWLPSLLFDPFVSLVKWVGTPLVPTTTIGKTQWILDTSDWSLVPPDLVTDHVWELTARNLISIVVIVLLTAFYSTTGGLRSVIRTDIVQFILMMVATAIFSVIVVNHAGGLGAIPERIADMFATGGPGGITPNQILAFEPTHAKDITATFLLLLAVQWLVHFNADGTGYLAQRSMACHNEREAKKAALIFTVVQILFRSLLWIPLGLGLLLIFLPHVNWPFDILRAERESTYVRGMAELLPPGVMGLMVTGMLAALASTVDTHLNWGSSYWTNDLYRRFFCPLVLKREPSPRSLVWVARCANLFIIVISLIIMTRLTNVEAAWKTSLVLGAGMGVILVLRWVWWRITAWGEIVAILVSLILAPILLNAELDEALRLLIMAVVATGAGVLVSLLFGPEDKDRLAEFYTRVRPCGFWKPIALSVGENGNEGVLRLRRGLGALVLSALSIFCLLTGIGSWMVGSPPPTFFPWRVPWLAFLLLVGGGLIPLWWRLGFSEKNKAGERLDPQPSSEEIPERAED